MIQLISGLCRLAVDRLLAGRRSTLERRSVFSGGRASLRKRKSRGAQVTGSVSVEALENRQLLSASRHSPEEIPEEVVRAVPRIINGTQIPDSEFPTVGIVGSKRRLSGFCTGTLIAENWVLTAAHCSKGVGKKKGRFLINGEYHRTERVLVHPEYSARLFGTDDANDIALWKLKDPVIGILPSQILRDVPFVGEDLTLVGFGGGGNGNSGSDGDFGTKRVGNTPIDEVTGTLIHWTFDDNSESNTAPGDSGGPAFVNRGGTLYVAGITSGGESDTAAIGDSSYDTRVDVFASWIDQTMQAFNFSKKGKPKPVLEAFQREARILNGVPTSEYQAVGIVGSMEEPEGFGTGTLISSEWVLTAAHVVSGLNDDEGVFHVGGETYSSSEIHVFPRYRPHRVNSNKGNDIALMRLSRPVTNVTPMNINRAAPGVGTSLTLVGFGSGGTFEGGEDDDFGTKRVGTTPLEKVTKTRLRWVFDNPTEANTGHGDSGGPAFVSADGELKIAGITSGGTKKRAGRGDKAFDTRVDVFASWIDEVMASGVALG